MPGPLELLAALPLESGRRWGDVATEVQWEDARAVLTAGGPRRHWLGRSRGYSKTTDVAAFSLVALICLLAPGATAYCAASDRDQARLLLAAIAGFVRRVPVLRHELDVQAWRVVSRKSGAVLEVLAADASSSWGLTGSLYVIDEICQWPRTPNAQTFLDALLSALPKVPDSRCVVISTAGDPGHWSRRLYDLAREDPLWRLSEVHGPAPWMRSEEVDAERRRLLPSMFSRLFMNEWCTAEEALVDDADLDACAVLDGPQPYEPGRTYRVGVDIGLKSDRTVMTVCHGERLDGGRVRVVLDRQVVFAGTKANPVRFEDIEAAMLAAHLEYARPRFVVDPWQAQASMQRLRSKGVRLDEFTFSSASVGRLAVTLFTLLRDRLLALPADDAELREELLTVRLCESSPGVVRIDHESGRHDDRVISLALAAQALVSRSATPGSANAAVGVGRIRRGPTEEEAPSAIPRGSELDRRRLRVSGVAVDSSSMRGRSVHDELARARRSAGYVGPGA